jgi:hypothetical protein
VVHLRASTECAGDARIEMADIRRWRVTWYGFWIGYHGRLKALTPSGRFKSWRSGRLLFFHSDLLSFGFSIGVSFLYGARHTYRQAKRSTIHV